MPGLLAGQALPTDCAALCLARHARAALAAGHRADYLMYARRLAARTPDHPGVIYAVASGFAMLGQIDSSIDWLDRLARMGASRTAASDSTFALFWNSPALLAIQARFDSNRVPIIRGKTAFSLPDPDLVPEALAWDPSTGSWLVGSLAKRKVIKVGPDGSATDFVSTPDLLRVVGIHVDSARGLLWFATWAPRRGATRWEDAVPSGTRLFRCDLRTGRVLRRYVPEDSARGHLFNDLAIASNGDVFVTDTEQGWLYRIRTDIDSLEVFLRPDPDQWSGANGITFGGDDRTLYVAFVEGIARIDRPTREIVRLAPPAMISTAQIDGLYWHGGALVAVQNQPGLKQVSRYELTSDGRSIRRASVLERSDTLVRAPTTGAVVGNLFYYIANSQYERLGYDNRLSHPEGSPTPLTTVRVINLREP